MTAERLVWLALVATCLAACPSAERKHACELAKVEASKVDALMGWCVDQSATGRIGSKACEDIGGRQSLAQETRNRLCYSSD